MKINPGVMERIQAKHTSFELDFSFEYNITFIVGDSGTGKSVTYSIIEEMSAEDKRIRCFNYLDMTKKYRTTIKNSKGKLFVIDNADILLDDALRSYIALDENNQYVIFGRNPTRLLLTQDEIFELRSETNQGVTVFSLKKVFEV